MTDDSPMGWGSQLLSSKLTLASHKLSFSLSRHQNVVSNVVANLVQTFERAETKGQAL